MQGLEAILGLSTTVLGAWFAGLLVLAVARVAVTPTVFKALAASAGLGFLAWTLTPVQLALVLGSTSVLYGLREHPRVAASFLALVLLPILFSGQVLGDDDRFASLLFVIYFKKACYRTWETGVAKSEPPDLAETAYYFLSMPFVLGKAAVVSPTEWRMGFAQVGLKDALLSGARTAATALGALAVFYLMSRASVHLLVDRDLVRGLDELTWPWIWLAVTANWVAIFLFRFGHDQLSIAGARLFGHRIRDNYENPLMARDYAEFWRHWNIHFRDMVVRFFYFPVVLRLNRSQPKKKIWNLGAAVVLTFTGHAAFMLLARGIHLPIWDGEAWLELAIALAIYETFEALFVWLTLAWQLRRGRRPAGWLRAIPGIVLTFHARAFLVLLVLRSGVRLADLGELFGRMVGLG
ncbi:MAG: hypothetical protein GY884_24220 [Proteobacteria bacterium]|nr:hypothetical protein [Pseudomonadota bacterium]